MIGGPQEEAGSESFEKSQKVLSEKQGTPTGDVNLDLTRGVVSGDLEGRVERRNITEEHLKVCQCICAGRIYCTTHGGRTSMHWYAALERERAASVDSGVKQEMARYSLL